MSGKNPKLGVPVWGKKRSGFLAHFRHEFVAETWALSKFEARARWAGQTLNPLSGHDSHFRSKSVDRSRAPLRAPTVFQSGGKCGRPQPAKDALLASTRSLPTARLPSLCI